MGSSKIRKCKEKEGNEYSPGQRRGRMRKEEAEV